MMFNNLRSYDVNSSLFSLSTTRTHAHMHACDIDDNNVFILRPRKSVFRLSKEERNPSLLSLSMSTYFLHFFFILVWLVAWIHF